MDAESFAKENWGMVGLTFLVLASMFVLLVVFRLWDGAQSNRAIIENLRIEEKYGEEIVVSKNTCKWPNLYWEVAFSVILGIWCLCSEAGLDTKMVIVVMVIACRMICRKRLRERSNPSGEAVLRQISYELPLVMERMVMAVQAGHDILPALKLVVHAGEDVRGGTVTESQVQKIFREVIDAVEAGMTLQSSLRTASFNTKSTSLRHALLHIAVAHEQGGGLLFALSELADATQSYYQESVEEQIATLPVKATLPLVIVFGGLLVILLTSPIIQTLDTTASYGVMK